MVKVESPFNICSPYPINKIDSSFFSRFSPYCPDGYLCIRDSTGDCPNTNVPYCIAGTATAPPTEPTVSLPPPLFQYYSSPAVTQFYSRPYPVAAASSDTGAASFSDHRNFGYGYHRYNEKKVYAQAAPQPPQHASKNEKEEEEDVCARSGLTRVGSELIFDQLQERRIECEEPCEILEWDEECDNTCIYQTETTCCIQTICLPNN